MKFITGIAATTSTYSTSLRGMSVRPLCWAASLAACVVIVALGVCGSAFAVGDANEASCPNGSLPGFESYLPDCRAYEMVSPPYTEGFNVKEPSVAAHATSVDGPVASFGDGLFIGQSFGVFAGAENTNNFGGRYLFTRTASGWSALSFEPSATVFPESGSITGGVETEPVMSDTLRSSIWELGTSLPGSTDTPDLSFYLREADGAFVPVGPSIPSGSRVVFPSKPLVRPIGLGASSDLSHLVFGSTIELEPEEPFWPGDETLAERTSLYEYVGTHNPSPTMVGVTGGTGSTSLISQCGASLGDDINNEGTVESGSQRSVYNAVSATGGTVFFTVAPGGCLGLNPQTKVEEVGVGPAVREVYARIDGERTVAVSEPTTGVGGDCEACQEGSPAAATYEAASSDGFRVLFATEQELLPGNPGNNLYEYDFDAPAGHKITAISHVPSGAASGFQGLATVSADLSHIYFVATEVLTGTEENAEHEKAVAGKDNLYVYEPNPAIPGQSKTVFIATLTPGDSGDWQGFNTQDQNKVQGTPDGRFLLFPSAAHLTSDDTSHASQLFQYDAETNTLTRVSKGQDGYEHDGNGEGNVEVGGTGSGEHKQSADGAYVFFDSPVPLVPQAAASAGYNSVYEYHAGSTYLISDGHDTTSYASTRGSNLAGVSPSGEDVYFTTGDPLVPADTNTQVGIYDARIDGGFPGPVEPSSCGKSCQGPPVAPPMFGTPASATFNGPGNLTPPPSPPSTVKSKPKPSLTRERRLAQALGACRRERMRKRRASCERRARERYGAKRAAAKRRGKQ